MQRTRKLVGKLRMVYSPMLRRRPSLSTKRALRYRFREKSRYRESYSQQRRCRRDHQWEPNEWAVRGWGVTEGADGEFEGHRYRSARASRGTRSSHEIKYKCRSHDGMNHESDGRGPRIGYLHWQATRELCSTSAFKRVHSVQRGCVLQLRVWVG